MLICFIQILLIEGDMIMWTFVKVNVGFTATDNVF